MIKIAEDWAIEKDKYCLILKKRRVVKKEDVWDAESYHKDIPQLIKAMVDRELFSEENGDCFAYKYYTSLKTIENMVRKVVESSYNQRSKESNGKALG